MDNYKTVEVKITYCFWSDVHSSYMVGDLEWRTQQLYGWWFGVTYTAVIWLVIWSDVHSSYVVGDLEWRTQQLYGWWFLIESACDVLTVWCTASNTNTVECSAEKNFVTPSRTNLFPQSDLLQQYCLFWSSDALFCVNFALSKVILKSAYHRFVKKF
jgi:hypothetical protein